MCKWGSRSENSGLLPSTPIWGEVAWIRELKQGTLSDGCLGTLLPSVRSKALQPHHSSPPTLGKRLVSCTPKPPVLKLLVNVGSSLLIFLNSCWVHLGLLTTHSLQHKRWMELGSRGMEFFLFIVFLFFCLLCSCFAFV